jgi:hypothetical protein
MCLQVKRAAQILPKQAIWKRKIKWKAEEEGKKGKDKKRRKKEKRKERQKERTPPVDREGKCNVYHL